MRAVILWCDGAHDPGENMARDAALLAAAEAPDLAPEAVLRLFRFDPPGITLGYAQDPARELDLERCRVEGVPWAKRPTGGRAIFHAEEWTYALAAPIGDRDWGGSLERAYQVVSELVCRSLVRLGVPAELAAGRARSAGPVRSTRGPAAPCFASTARHEIVLAGRKLVGSAQRRTARAILQQGSVLLGPGHLRLADYLACDERVREERRSALAAGAADAGRILGARAPLERWADALERELPAGVRRVDGAPARFLLTGSKPHPYTASSV